ncbi:hypothetical protein E4T50_03407 [Aureobasidium sp. EXF-12298]|nr:hypothetical protein E4T50_03407 [Aureobasidium sp. EXF-12298]
MVIAKSEHSMRRVPEDDETDSQSDVHSLHQVLPVEDDIFTAPSLTPHIEDFEVIWQNSALKTTIGDPPLYLCLPDYELTDTMIIFFDTITELLSVPQNEFDRNITASKAASTIDSLYLSYKTETNNDPERFLYGIWPPIFELIQQIPPDHYAVQRLVALIAELKIIDIETLHIWGRDIRLWPELPLFAPEFVENVEGCLGYEGSSLKGFRDLLEEQGVYKLFDYSKVAARK